MSEEYVSKRSFTVNFGETLAMADFQSIRPLYGETVEIITQLIPGDTSIEDIRDNFIEEVRGRYLAVREQSIKDFYVKRRQ